MAPPNTSRMLKNQRGSESHPRSHLQSRDCEGAVASDPFHHQGHLLTSTFEFASNEARRGALV
jgi:hypothetical protein